MVSQTITFPMRQEKHAYFLFKVIISFSSTDCQDSNSGRLVGNLVASSVLCCPLPNTIYCLLGLLCKDILMENFDTGPVSIL